MDNAEIGRIAEIDRSEHITLFYTHQDGRLETQQVDWDTPTWSTDDSPDHSVQANIRAWRPILDEHGGTMYGAFDGDRLVGFVIFRPHLTTDTAQLAVLHVSRAYRRRGIATALAEIAHRLAVASGAKKLYVSATPSGSAVGFYRSQGFDLVDRPHPALFALEPEDIHLTKAL